MKNFLKENWFQLIVIFILLLFFIFLFRNNLIRKKCKAEVFLSENNIGTINSSEWLDQNEKLYKDCVSWYGINY